MTSLKADCCNHKEKAAGLHPAAYQNNLQNPSYQNSFPTQGNCSVLEYAVVLAESGIPVFPCLYNKAPACVHGFKEPQQTLRY